MVWINRIIVILYAFAPVMILLICNRPIKKKEKRIDYIYSELQKSKVFDSIGFNFRFFTTSIMLLIVTPIIYLICLKVPNDKLYKVLQGDCDLLFILINIVVTLAVALIVYNKKIYIAFSLKDYLSEYEFGYYFMLMIMCGSAHSFVTMIDWPDVIHMICALRVTFEVFGICYIIKCFKREYIVLFGTRNAELDILKKLYRVYNIKNTRYTIHDAELDEEAIEINIDYLFQNFVSCYQRANADKITGIEYVHFKEENWEKWGGEAKKVLFIFLALMCGVSAMMAMSEKDLNEYILLPIIIFVIFFLGSFVKNSFVNNMILNVWKDKSGFCVIRKKKYFLEFFNDSPKAKKYLLFIQSITSIAAFSEIILSQENQNDKFIYNIKNRVEKIEEKEINVGVEILPYFLVGYVLYKKKYKMKSLKKLYKKDRIANYDKMLEAFMEYMDGRIINNSQKEYIDWLSDKTNKRKVID